MKSAHQGFSLLFVVAFIVVLSVGSISLFKIMQSNNKAEYEKTVTTPGTEPGTINITGVIDSFNHSCRNIDEFCTINLKDGTQLVTECGGSRPDGEAICMSFDRRVVTIEDKIEATVIQKDDGRYYLECETCGIKILSDVSYYIPNYDESSPGSPPGTVNLRGIVTSFFDERTDGGNAGVIIDNRYRVITATASNRDLPEAYWGDIDDVQEGDVVRIFADYVSNDLFTIGSSEGTHSLLKVQ